MIVTRFLCVAEGCDFCDNDEERAEEHSKSYGDQHDLLKVEYDPYYKKATVHLLDNSSISTTTN